MSEMTFAMFGAGFWSEYQLAAWQELPDARCIAICDPKRSKAEKLAKQFDVQAVYGSGEELLANESPGFLDVVTNVETHAESAELGIQRGIPVICQKPMAPTLEIARQMLEASQNSGVPLLIHENWRWQTPLRKLKEILDSGQLGTLVRARIDYANSFPVFDNQPFLRKLERFILTDIGSHILDVARFLFGEATHLYCQTRRMRADIKGEDVATVVMEMQDHLTVTCNMSYASRWEYDRFPETFVAVEGTEGGVSLGANYEVKVFGNEGSQSYQTEPLRYEWADPDYDLVHASIVDCHRNLLDSLQGKGDAETTADDNLRTLELVFGAYESAKSKSVVHLSTVGMG